MLASDGEEEVSSKVEKAYVPKLTGKPFEGLTINKTANKETKQNVKLVSYFLRNC